MKENKDLEKLAYLLFPEHKEYMDKKKKEREDYENPNSVFSQILEMGFGKSFSELGL